MQTRFYKLHLFQIACLAVSFYILPFPTIFSDEDIDVGALLKSWLRGQPEGCGSNLENWLGDYFQRALDWVLKQVTFTTSIGWLENCSISALFLLKHAVVYPLLMKPHFKPNDLKFFRPISKLPFFPKVLEKTVYIHLISFMKNMTSMINFNLVSIQVTALKLIKVTNDLLLTADAGDC